MSLSETSYTFNFIKTAARLFFYAIFSMSPSPTGSSYEYPSTEEERGEWINTLSRVKDLKESSGNNPLLNDFWNAVDFNGKI